MTDPFTISEPRDQLYVVKECLAMDFEAPNCERVGQGCSTVLECCMASVRRRNGKT